MTDQASTSVLHQMAQVRPSVTPDVPLTASRAIRLALTRAAERSIGMTLSVTSVAEDTLSLDELIETMSNDYLMVALSRDDLACGILACDFHFATATGEVQTTGKVMPRAPAERPLTRVDLSLVSPVCAQLLAELELTTPRTALDGWADNSVLGARFDDVRRIGFDLSDVLYRLIRLNIDVGVPDRGASLMVAMPLQAQALLAKTVPIPTVDWAEHFKASVLKAPATLDAVLHRFRMPLHVATNLEVGQVIALPGCTVGSVRMMAPDGQMIARARLGQIAGPPVAACQIDHIAFQQRVRGHDFRGKITGHYASSF